MPPLLSEEAVRHDVQALRQRYEDVLGRLRALEAEMLLFRKEMSENIEEEKRKKTRRLVHDL